ncbi:MAG: adenylosuccinate synthetase [Candidatus Micrarchaeota archaeon]|nr:adenylosuccinate synthetase [Candidatus Micrarchaeota archaeon]MBU1682182.1 adenylosuccinate synthetase [Candidatus Micrarchaeota archaeon]
MKNILVGGQFGDEGKGKIISHLALADDPEVIARGGVGPNAGHEVHYKGKRYPMRMLSCGFVNENARLLIGAGVYVNPEVFLKEIELINGKERCGIDFRAGLITPEHIEEDSKSSLSKKIGTTKTGCGPAVADRTRRTAARVMDCPELKPYMTDVVEEVNKAKNVLVEGSQGFMLSLLYGTYPFVTSKDVSASTIAADVGIGPTKIDDVIMVIKSYTTRVGEGPFDGEIKEEEAKSKDMQEYGTVTGRPRRTSPDLHYDELRLAANVNGATQIAITKIDIRFPGNAGVKKYDELTNEAKAFIEKVEKELDVPVTLIGTGPDAEEIIDKRT